VLLLPHLFTRSHFVVSHSLSVSSTEIGPSGVLIFLLQTSLILAIYVTLQHLDKLVPLSAVALRPLSQKWGISAQNTASTANVRLFAVVANRNNITGCQLVAEDALDFRNINGEKRIVKLSTNSVFLLSGGTLETYLIESSKEKCATPTHALLCIFALDLDAINILLCLFYESKYE
jgi:hypothetical protein